MKKGSINTQYRKLTWMDAPADFLKALETATHMTRQQ